MHEVEIKLLFLSPKAWEERVVTRWSDAAEPPASLFSTVLTHCVPFTDSPTQRLNRDTPHHRISKTMSWNRTPLYKRDGVFGGAQSISYYLFSFLIFNKNRQFGENAR